MRLRADSPPSSYLRDRLAARIPGSDRAVCRRPYRVARLVRAAERLESEHWQRLLRDAAIRTGVRRGVTVMLSDAVGGPITSGLFRPVVLLPADAETWTAERREVVLLHELAHVARMDYAAQLIATAACTAFWFHPVVWIAAARMRLEAEHAADDRVLTAGLPSVRYATHLVELARRAAIGEPAAVAVGIAHRTHIERRISAMLDTTRSRTAISTRLQCAAGTAAMLLLVPLAGIRTEATAAGVVNVYTPEPTPAIAAAVVVASASVTNVARPVTPRPVAVATTVQRADSVFDTTIEASSGGRVVLDLDTGGEVVIHGWDEPRVRVRVRLAGTNWRDTRVALGRVSGGVRLSSEFNRELRTMSTDHEFELWIPKQSDIELSSAGGRLSMEDVEGRFRGSTGGGEIDIRRASGRSSLSTGGGNVMVTQSNLSGTVSTGGGSVTLSQVTGGLRGSSGSGPVVYAEQPGQRGRSTTSRDTTADLSGMTITSNRITTGEGRGNITTNSRGVTQNFTQIGPLHISKAGGNITLDAAPEGGTVHTGGGKIVIGRAGGELTVSTGGGDIEIERITGSTRVSTGAGDVNLTIDGDDGRAQIIEATSGQRDDRDRRTAIVRRTRGARGSLYARLRSSLANRQRLDAGAERDRASGRARTAARHENTSAVPPFLAAAVG